jgi:hypothetical protein
LRHCHVLDAWWLLHALGPSNDVAVHSSRKEIFLASCDWRAIAVAAGPTARRQCASLREDKLEGCCRLDASDKRSSPTASSAVSHGSPAVPVTTTNHTSSISLFIASSLDFRCCRKPLNL